MTSSRYSQVTDELLSAYIDEAVSAEERVLIEAALAAEPEIAWRLEALRQTVQLVRSLPAIALPRSLPQGFVLSALPAPVVIGHRAQAQPGVGLRVAARQSTTGWTGFWQGLRSFWFVGSPLLRNATAVSFALLVVFTAGDYLLAPSAQSLTRQPTVFVTANEDAGRVAKQSEQPTPLQLTATNAAAPTPEKKIAQTPEANLQGESAPVEENIAPQTQSPAASASFPLNGDRNAAAEKTLATSSLPDASGSDENRLGDESGAEADEELTGMPAESLSKVMELQEATITPTAVVEAAQDVSSPATSAPAAAVEPQADEITGPQPTAVVTALSTLAASTDITPVRTTQGAATTIKSAGTATQDATSWSTAALLQSVTALLTLLFATLWWRSRRRVDGILEQ